MYFIKQATAADADAVAVLFEALIREIVERSGGTTTAFGEADPVELSRTLLAGGEYRVWLALQEASGEPAGFLSLHGSASLYAGGRFGIIQELYVRPADRSHGLGRRLLEAAAAYAAESGWKRLEVCTPPLPAFERSLAFYEREGFVVTGGRKLKLTVT
ncbi:MULTISPECIES: GNAT family N-acetyltransferase [Paenibacillus]|uniref:GNAT family N-acetyltransferase n=1 Tax=Paenibacillus TaxID=44249 RepID=UPI0022B88080|nr:GNAT family N-acetyltransferase [Paenibacillus caseinilyticus]MCZ8521783.1 GNAT family N-acetyltransferase [Paenibacillus caseinilyticus]